MNSFQYNLARFISFQDKAECERVRQIKKEDITNHPNPDFKIQVIEERDDFYFQFAMDIFTRIVEAREKKESLVLILPVGPVPQYSLVAKMVNQFHIPLDLSLIHI